VTLPARGPVEHPSAPRFPAAFQRLFAADMVSLFGSLISRTALPFVAILFLGARPLEVALLSVADIVAGLASALWLGGLVDRWPKRRVMMVADMARAGLLFAIPLGAWMGWLNVPLLLVVALACGVFNVAFELAYAALLPRLLADEQLLAGNSRIAAGQSVVETASFGVGGWLVQWLGAPVAVLVDALSYLGSAWLLWRVDVAFVDRGSAASGAGSPPPVALWREAREGLQLLWRDPVLRTLAAVEFCVAGGQHLFGAVFLIYLARDLGFGAGELGMIFAVGGVSAFFGAALAGRLSTRWATGSLMIGALACMAAAQFLPPLASAAGWAGAALLIVQQLLGDGAATVYQINDSVLRQTLAPSQALARVNAGIRFTGLAAMLLGALAGGLVAEAWGARTALFCAAGWLTLAVPVALGSALRRLDRRAPRAD
jgi:MFS family permease